MEVFPGIFLYKYDVEDNAIEPPAKKAKLNENEIQNGNGIFSFKFSIDERVSHEKIEVFFNEWLAARYENLDSFIEKELIPLLSNNSVKQYFKNNLEKYCLVIKSLLNGIESVKLFDSVLCGETVFFKTLMGEREFHKHFLSIVLPTLVEVIVECQDDPRRQADLFEESSEIVKKCLFDKNSEDFETYFDEVLNLSNDKPKEKTSLPKEFLKFFISTYELGELESSLTFKIVFQSLFLTKKNFSLIYKLFIIITKLLGFDLSKNFEFHKISRFKEVPLEFSKSLNLLGDIIYIIKNNEVDSSCVVKISFPQFIENLLQSVIHTTKFPTSVSFKILTHCIEIHPILVESNLNNLIVYSMLANNLECEKEYNEFLIKIFETYSKLHRIQNLISKMIPILKTSMNESYTFEECYSFENSVDSQKEFYIDVDKILPENVLNYFTECIIQMASWQVMNLFKTFIFHFNVAVAEFAENKGKNEYLQLLCRLSSWVLKSIRMAENTITATVTEKFSAAMDEFKTILSKLGESLLKQEHDRLLVGEFLKLSYDWSLMYIVFCYYNKEDSDEIADICNFKHSFLNEKQWILLSERISNFGEATCKQLMLKLLEQKMKAVYLFGNRVDSSIQKEILGHVSSDLENNYLYFIKNEFLKEHLLHEIDHNLILKMAYFIVENAEKTSNIEKELTNNLEISNAVTYAIFSKLSEQLKLQSSDSLYAKILSEINLKSCVRDKEINFELKRIFEKYIWKKEKKVTGDLNRINFYLKLLKELPLPYLSDNVQSFSILSLFALHKIVRSSGDRELKNLLEKAIIGFSRVVKFDFLILFEPITLVKIITGEFDDANCLIAILSELSVKQESCFQNFIPIIEYLLENIKEGDNLQNTLTILNDLLKVKKSKSNKDFKDVCSKMKDQIMNKHFEIIEKEKPNFNLVHSYAVCLKDSLASNTDDNEVNKIKMIKLSNDYLNLAFRSKKINKESLLLFSTILHNRQILKMTSDLPLKIWKFCKDKEGKSTEDSQELLSQLLCSVLEQVANEEFKSVTEDLLETILPSIDFDDNTKVSKHLKTCSNMLTSSLNPTKFKLWQQILEKILFRLNNTRNYSQEDDQQFANDMIDFDLIIIQHHQLLLSPTMIGIFLINPYDLLRNEHLDFYFKFHRCVDYLDNLLKHRNPLILDRLPPYLKVFRSLLTNLCDKCERKENEKDINVLEKLADCAHRLEKLIRQLVVNKKDVARIAPHLIADILHEYERATLFPKIKIHLNNCLYSLISVCDQHATSYLLRILSVASTELFKLMFESYKKFYRFTGKV